MSSTDESNAAESSGTTETDTITSGSIEQEGAADQAVEAETLTRKLMRQLRNGFAAIGVFRLALIMLGCGALTAALLVLFAPQVLPSELPTESLNRILRNRTFQLLGLFALFAGFVFYVAQRLFLPGLDFRSRVAEPIPYPPETVHRPIAAQSGELFDTHLAHIGSDGDERHAEHVAASLEETAVSILVTYGGHEEETAISEVESGTWTSDLRAAAYLGGPDAPTPRWYIEVWDRLHPRPRTVRRIHHTIAALEEYTEKQDGRSTVEEDKRED